MPPLTTRATDTPAASSTSLIVSGRNTTGCDGHMVARFWGPGTKIYANPLSLWTESGRSSEYGDRVSGRMWMDCQRGPDSVGLSPWTYFFDHFCQEEILIGGVVKRNRPAKLGGSEAMARTLSNREDVGHARGSAERVIYPDVVIYGGVNYTDGRRGDLVHRG